MAAKHGQFTDPLQPEDSIDKWMPSQTDRVQPQAHRIDKLTPSQTDWFHNPQAVNPQPLPPGFQDETTIHIWKDFPTGLTRQPMWGVGQALRNPIGIILAVVIVLGLLGGTLILTHQGGSQPVMLSSPGVYAWQDSTSLGQNQMGLETPCKGTLAPGIEQRLIGGGYTLSRSLAPISALPGLGASSLRNVTASWDTGFIPGAGGAQLTNYAICLREPTSFFGGSPIQYESTEMKTFPNPGPQAIKATCPAGMSVLGGGYVIQPYQQGETQPATIDSSFPYADDSGAGWEIVADSVNGLDQAQAWAVCSGALHTHLESASAPNVGVFQSAITCSQGTLLGGGFDLLQPRGDNSFSTDYAREDSPGKTLHQDAVQGDTFSDWRVIGEINGVGPHYTATLWAVCWDQNGSTPVTAPTTAPTAAPTSAPTHAPTVAPTVAPTSTPVAAPTASPVPQPTATTPASCSVVKSGNGVSLDSSTEYVNLDTGKSSNMPANMSIEWNPPGLASSGSSFSAVNEAMLASVPVSPTGYSGVTCAELKGLTFGQQTIQFTNGVVFAVKLLDGHYAKVQASQPPSGGVTIQWTTYYP